MSDWIPFHRRLAKGPKKGLPRAVRFVLLELSLESRATRGVIDLPPAWDTVDAVHDLLGGNKREIAIALKAFTSESREEDNAISIEKGVGVHRIVVKKWGEWAGPKSVGERVAAHRQRKQELTVESPLHRVTVVTPTGQDSTGHNKTGEGETPAPEESDQTPEQAAASMPAPPPAAESDYDLGRRVFTEAWEKKYRERWFSRSVQLGGRDDDNVFREIGRWATEHGGADREAFAVHLVGMYMRDHGKRGWLDENRHPVRALVVSLTSYGEPPRKRPPESATRVKVDEPADAPLSAKELAERAAAFAKKGAA